jgi:multisubunit Na+/H+ antiporter MnhB subunit
MDIGLVITALAIILFAIAMILLHRPDKEKKYQYAGAWSSSILIGFAILLREYDLIPSIVGWSLVILAISVFWILFYDMFFRRKKK